MSRDAKRPVGPLFGLSLRQRFRVWRAVYAGRAVEDPALASAAVEYARKRHEDEARWTWKWLRSFMPDLIDIDAFALFSIALLIFMPHWSSVAIVVGGFVTLVVVTRRRRRKRARQAELANRRLLERGQGETAS
jgi:hypothetical protein